MRTSSNSNSKTNIRRKSCLSNKTYQQQQQQEDYGSEFDLGLNPQNQDPSFVSHQNYDDTNGGAHPYYYKMTDSSSSNTSRVYDMTCTTVTPDSTPCLLGLRPFNLQPFHVSHSSFFSSGSGMATAGVGFPFTEAQWKELERQAMIYKYMVASLPVPPNLLHSYFPSNPTSYWLGKYDSGFDYKWVGNSKDAEPGRCRRTDGKKWRCSRDVAPNKKYCERHMHRGRPCSRKPVEQLQRTHSLTDFPINESSYISDGIKKNNPTKKTRLNHLNSSLSVESSCFPSAKSSAFYHQLASGATPFEDSRNMVWTEEQQWQQLVQENMNSQVYQHQFESDAWSTEVTGIKDNTESNKPCLASSNVNHDEVCQMYMGQGVLGQWAGTCPSLGGPLAEVLRPSSVSNNPVTSNVGEGDFITTLTATSVSSPSGVLAKTLATFSDSSGSSSPTGHNSKVK